MPPVTENDFFSVVCLPPLSTLYAPAPDTDATLNEKACAEPMYGFPIRLNRIRSMALASVAVPTVEFGLAPMRC